MAITANNREIKIRSIYEEIYIFKSFLNQQEKQVNEYIQNINSRKESYDTTKIIFTGNNNYEEILVSVDHIEGISEDDYDIVGLFTEDFPLYQRQSMLLTLWSLFESKLKDIYDLLISESGQQPRKKKKNQSDFSFFIDELTKLGCNFNDERIANILLFLNGDVRNIRNDWVHHGGIPKRDYRDLINQNKIKITSRKIDLSNVFLNDITDQILATSEHIINELTR